MKTGIVASLIMALLFAALIFGSEAGAQTPALTPTATLTPTVEPTDTPKPQRQEELPPGRVRNMGAFSDSDGVHISWDAPALPLFGPGASYYYYQYRVASGSWTSWKYTASRSFTIRSIANGQSYGAQAYACNGAGCGGSSSVSGTYRIAATPTNTPRVNATATPTPIQRSTSNFTWDTHLDSERKSGYDKYGYDRRRFGDMDDDRFTYAGRRYRIDHIIWDDSREELKFELSECLKPSEFISLKIGSRAFRRSDIEDAEETDADCDADRGDNQEFEFETSRNPLPVRDGIDIELTLVGGGISAAPTHTPTATHTPTFTPTATPIVVVTSTATAIATPSATPTPTATAAPFWVEISSSDEYPKAKDTVTLTANVLGAPTGGTLTYQWQTKNGSAWSNDGSASSASTKSVTSEKRGTKAYRVVATHSAVGAATSLPFYVTWDEWAIVVDMIEDMVEGVEGAAGYNSTLSKLTTCMKTNVISGASAKITFSTLDDVFSRYTGYVKSVADGACGPKLNAMIVLLERELPNALNALETDDSDSTKAAEYAALLETPQGNLFEANVGDFDIAQRYLTVLASASIPSISGASATTLDECFEGTGDYATLSLERRIELLNCLVFKLPHDFWVAQSLKTISDNDLKSKDRFRWLGYEDWDCTSWIDGPLPSCLKHDVAWASLKKFVVNDDDGITSNDEEDDTLDATWNPRNKYLADEKFYADIKANGCQNRTDGWGPNIWCTLPSLAQAFTMQYGVRNINSKGWPYTSYDIDHIGANYQFTDYQIPNVTNVSVSKPDSSLLDPYDHYIVSWTYYPGTVSTAAVFGYRLCWEKVTLGLAYETCETISGDSTSYTLKIPKLSLVSIRSLKSIEIAPYRNLLRFGGLYYPRQTLNLKYD